MCPARRAGWQIKIADFGSASLFDPSRLHALGITNLGFTQTTSLDTQALTGTLMYLAPEVLAGQSPSASADVYALGVMLYQLAIGDFRKPLAPGWEAEIQDPLLREDIADAACGDPAKRLNSAADLVERLLTLEQRRIKRDELETAKLSSPDCRAQAGRGPGAASLGRVGRNRAGGWFGIELHALSKSRSRTRHGQPPDRDCQLHQPVSF